MKFGVDYSWARPGGAALKQAGCEFVIRYVPYPGDSGKGLHLDELNDLHSNGLAVCLVYESTAHRPLSGYEAGRADAQQTLKSLQYLGWPDDRPVYFAVDFDAQPHQFGSITQYFRGVADVMGLNRVGVYGGIKVLEHCKASNLAKWYWQALAWSGGRAFPGRHLYQYLNGQFINGGEVDFNEAYYDDFGQWPVAKEDNLSAEQVALLEAVLTALTGYSDAAKQSARLKEWNFYPPGHENAGKARGNSLLDGYIQLQQRVAEVAQDLSSIAGAGGATGIFDRDEALAIAERLSDLANTLRASVEDNNEGGERST